MFTIVMCLEERNTQVKLKHDAADRPHITRLSPAKLQNDFRGTVVTCRHNGAVVFMIKRSAAEIYQANVGIFNPTNFAILHKESN